MLKALHRTHIQELLSSFEPFLLKPASSSPPLDLHLKSYFKSHKSLGSHDRATIADTVFKIIRYKTYLDLISRKPVTWGSRIEGLFSQDFDNKLKNPSFKPNVRCSCPEELFRILTESYGEGKAFEYCESWLEKAPLTIRSNPLKISREDLFETMKLVDRHKKLEKCAQSPLGIKFTSMRNQNLFETMEFQRGLFEIQDEGSQLAGLQVKCQPGEKVLDFCAGSGGKTLTFGPFMKQKGQIYLYDQREKALLRARKRLNRAGLQNIQLISQYDELKSKLAGKMDWVVLDVPCTGTGTLRRNPDLKLKFSPQALEQITALQEKIVESSLVFLRKNGKLVYITCSILPQENIDQIRKICEKFNLLPAQENHLQIMPEKGGMDCFFAFTLTRP